MLRSKHRGAYSEFAATNWLLAQGYEVFRNVSAHGPADLIAWNPITDERIFVDVKTFCNIDGEPICTDEQVALGVKLLCVTYDGHVFWPRSQKTLKNEKHKRRGFGLEKVR